jgi:hypothetical protein
MATKPNAGTCWIREQVVEDLPSGLILRVDKFPNGTRLVIAGLPLRAGAREILFDSDGVLLGMGPYLKKLHL